MAGLFPGGRQPVIYFPRHLNSTPNREFEKVLSECAVIQDVSPPLG
jgi:hypothetical protein